MIRYQYRQDPPFFVAGSIPQFYALNNKKPSVKAAYHVIDAMRQAILRMCYTKYH